MNMLSLISNRYKKNILQIELIEGLEAAWNSAVLFSLRMNTNLSNQQCIIILQR